MNEPDTLIISGFGLGYSAINCYKVILLQIPGKVDTEVKNKENIKKENKPDGITAARPGTDSREQKVGDASVMQRGEENMIQVGCLPAQGLDQP